MRRPGGGKRSGFSLLEIIVVMFIITLLIAILLPALSNVRRSMKQLKCTSNMRTLVFNFQLFVDGTSSSGQGDSESYGETKFQIGDFLDSQYAIDEFWDKGPLTSAPIRSRDSLLLCPEGEEELMKYSGFSCGPESIRPVADVTVGANMRLQRPLITIRGRGFLTPANATRVSQTIMNRPYVPLLFDVDAKEAARLGVDPYFSAPPIDNPESPYDSGRYWFPSLRHGDKTNVAFVGGHVLSSKDAAEEEWNWEYQPHVSK